MRTLPLLIGLIGCTGLAKTGTDEASDLPTDTAGPDPAGGGGGGGGGGAGGGSGGNTAEDRFHPLDYAEASVHGPPTKLLQDDCTTCHAADFSGGTSGVSCDSCHQPDWQTNCTYCHGGMDNPTGAPPDNIDDSTGPLASFPSHSTHVEQTDSPAFACAECHVQPTDVFSPGHLVVGDTTPGVSEVAMAAGATFSNGTCSNLYCHGDGQQNGAVDNTFVSSCEGCHPSAASPDYAIAAMSGEHERHVLGEGYACSECHARTVDASGAIIDPTVHVDGLNTVDLPITWDPTAQRCDGDCHYDHSDSW